MMSKSTKLITLSLFLAFLALMFVGIVSEWEWQPFLLQFLGAFFAAAFGIGAAQFLNLQHDKKQREGLLGAFKSELTLIADILERLAAEHNSANHPQDDVKNKLLELDATQTVFQSCANEIGNLPDDLMTSIPAIYSRIQGVFPILLVKRDVDRYVALDLVKIEKNRQSLLEDTQKLLDIISKYQK